MAECKAWGFTNNTRKNKGNINLECICRALLNTEMLNSSDHIILELNIGYFASMCYEVDKVNKVLGLDIRTMGSLPTQILLTSVRLQVNLLLSIVVATVLYYYYYYYVMLGLTDVK